MQKTKIKNPAHVINSHILGTGLKKSVIARRAGMSYEALCRSLQGRRILRADELLSLMMALGLTLSDFSCLSNEGFRY